MLALKWLPEFFPAGVAAADRGPEGHVNKDTFNIISHDLPDLLLIKVDRIRLIRTGEVVSAVPAVAAIIHQLRLRKTARAVIVVIHRVICDRHDPLFAHQGHGFAEYISALQIAVVVTDFGGVIAVAVVAAGIDHGGFDLG